MQERNLSPQSLQKSSLAHPPIGKFTSFSCKTQGKVTQSRLKDISIKPENWWFFKTFIIILSANCISFANCTELLLCCICSNSLITFYLLLFCKTSAPPAPSPNTLHTCPPPLENHCWMSPTCSSGNCAPTSRTRGYAAAAKPEAETSWAEGAQQAGIGLGAAGLLCSWEVMAMGTKSHQRATCHRTLLPLTSSWRKVL